MDMAYTQFVESLGYFVYEVTNAEVLSELRAACDEADGSGARGAVSLKEVGLRDGRSAVQAKLAALASFEEMLARTGTGFLVGSSVTYADLALFASLSELSEDDTCPTLLTAFKWDHLRAFHDAIEKRPNVHAYLTSEVRMPRTGPHPTEGWGAGRPQPRLQARPARSGLK